MTDTNHILIEFSRVTCVVCSTSMWFVVSNSYIVSCTLNLLKYSLSTLDNSFCCLAKYNAISVIV